MANHPQVWLQLDQDERTITVGSRSFQCPYCDEELGSLIAAQLRIARRCACGALVSRISEDEKAVSPPNAMKRAFREIQEAIAERVEGHDAAVARLAVLGARHLHIGGRQRALIIGPSGSGKTTLATALASALDCPVTVWDTSVSSEVGWSGVSSADVFAEMYAAYDHSLDQLSRGILLCDEIDKLALRDATGSAREHRRGQQKSLLGILGGGVPVRFRESGDTGRTLSVTTDDMLIVGLGAFEGLASDPGPAELVAYGFMPEFASRFPVIVSLDGLNEEDLARVLLRDTEFALDAAREFGYEIAIPEAVYRYVSAAVLAGASSGITPRAGAGWLQTAVDEALIRLLDLEARPGTRLEIRPDDVPVPGRVRRARKS